MRCPLYAVSCDVWCSKGLKQNSQVFWFFRLNCIASGSTRIIITLATMTFSFSLSTEIASSVTLQNKILFSIFLLFLLSFVLGSLAFFPSELIWNYGSYRQLVGLLGRVISPVARPLPTRQHKQNKLRQTDMPRVGFEHTISCLRPRGHCDLQHLS
jgi:hypothetical protein